MTQYLFIPARHPRRAKLALLTFLLAFVVILLGAYTRLTDAGLSCPDWPNCYGFITAPHTASQLQSAAEQYPATPVNIKKAWTEMTHRYVAGTEGILILILCFSILLAREATNTKTAFITLGLIAFLGVQVMLGMLTVTEKLKPIIVLAHLLTGLSLLSLLWWTYLNLHPDFFTQKSNSHITPWLWLGFLIVVAQITLGGWVSTHYAGLACIDLPYCNGQFFPILQWSQLNTDLITIHMLHRIGAVVTAIYILGLGLYLWTTTATFKAIGLLMIALVALQFLLGILNVLWLRPVWLALIHHTVAIFLLLTLITSLIKSNFESRDNRYGALFT